jgi:hypothetical protein
LKKGRTADYTADGDDVLPLNVSNTDVVIQPSNTQVTLDIILIAITLTDIIPLIRMAGFERGSKNKPNVFKTNMAKLMKFIPKTSKASSKSSRPNQESCMDQAMSNFAALDRHFRLDRLVE